MAPIETVRDLSPNARDAFDAIIDVRAPGEFAEDRLPGAINLPVLDDAERAAVGTTYVQDDPFRARRAGAALVSRNIARHLETALVGKPPTFRPLLYCWRGGMRSNAMATVLAAVGWRVGVVEGGYRRWRRLVADQLGAPGEAAWAFVLLDGQTGAGKTALLPLLADAGLQTLDLEALAGHRGSVFGGFAKDQPSQKAFETGLWDGLSRLDPGRPIVLEAESRRIGVRTVPDGVWTAMMRAPRIELRVPLNARAAFAAQAYADIAADPERIDAALDRLTRYHARTRIDAWRALAAAGDRVGLAETLMADHYDPAYARSRAARGDAAAATVDMPDVGDDALARAALRIVEIVRAQAPGATARV